MNVYLIWEYLKLGDRSDMLTNVVGFAKTEAEANKMTAFLNENAVPSSGTVEYRWTSASEGPSTSWLVDIKKGAKYD